MTIALIKDALGDRVSDVRASQRLTSSASCLVAGGDAHDRMLERLLAMQNKAPATRPILEVNMRHPLVAAMAGDKEVGQGSVVPAAGAGADPRRRTAGRSGRVRQPAQRAGAARHCEGINRAAARTEFQNRPYLLEHDPEKWAPVFRKDHAQTKRLEIRGTSLAMTTPDGTDIFYGTIPVFRGFDSLMDPALYTPLPDDWSIGVADIVESTKAIAEARYKAVNMAGAAVIAAVTNALEGREFPFVFGGDGASFAVSPDDLERGARGAGGDRDLGRRKISISRCAWRWCRCGPCGRRASTFASPASDRRPICPMRCFPAAVWAGRKPR